MSLINAGDVILVTGATLAGIVRATGAGVAGTTRALRRSTAELHETLATALLILAGLHALVALAHHYILRDGVLRRMLPGLK